MRLVCPNCEAKYEVPDDAIPDTGRDVQCTNCGHSWFQMRGRTGASPFVAPASIDPVASAVEPAEPMPTPMVSEAVAKVVPDQPAAVEAGVVPEAVDEAIAEAVRAEAAPLTAFPATAPETAPVPEVAVSDGAAPEAEPEILQDIEPVADSAPVAHAERVADSAPEVEPAIEAVARAHGLNGADPVLEPGSLAELSAEAEALMPVQDAPVEMAGVTTDVIPDLAGEADREASSLVTAAPTPDYAVDDSVLAILREEAEREANARRAEALESQTDLGIDAAMPRKAAAIPEADARPAARRDLLPDVEEINSTLRPSEMQADADGTPDFVAPPPEAPRGFRSGFLSLMTVAILAAALYLVAPRLAVMVPALAGPLEGYVSIVDSLRLGLDGMMRSATVAISDG